MDWLIRGETLADRRISGLREGVAMPLRWVNPSNPVHMMARGIRARALELRDASDQRKFGRLKAGDTLACSRGKVLDLSAGGLRLLSRRKLKGLVGMALWDVNGGLKLYAEVVWSRRLGFRRHEIGMRFVDVTPELAADLTTLATENRVQRDYLREPAPPGDSA